MSGLLKLDHEMVTTIQAALSFAPLGTRDEALAALDELTAPNTVIGQLFVQEAELKELRNFAYWAVYALQGIAGEKRIVAPSVEKEAQLFLQQHAATVAKLVQHRRSQSAMATPAD